ncbi:ROK family protein [Roseibium litorale]|uniref:ROK family protein n=1 Tax=Roseibium litorale TaxID=2803841 RepID=A0ABR9CNM0_9HYPH|nr:ROK family protein [Roseibium litorale]MBD8892288.1 ROK family protein [Roseibium litorale]
MPNDRYLPLENAFPATSKNGGKPGLSVGIDLGGTKINAMVVDNHGKILARVNEPTAHGPDAPVLDQLSRVVTSLANQAGASSEDVRTVAIGIPAAISPQTGLASLSPNLYLPEDIPLAELLGERLPLTCILVENDVNLAAYGEASAMEAPDGEPVVFLSFGTGVGMGLVIGKNLIRGAFGRGGEIAYLPLGPSPHEKAPGSQNGIFEDIVGTPGIRATYCREGETVADLFQRAEAGEADAVAAIDGVAREASAGVGAIQSLLDPMAIVIGGGIGSQPRFQKALARHVDSLLPFPCALQPSRFGAEAGVIGAALFALRHT